jgi:hypothetical protein
MVQLNRLSNGALAGLLAGGLMGIGARISMRVVALFGEMNLSFSLSGTLGILVLFTVFGALFGVLYAVVRPFIPLRAQVWGGIYGAAWAALASLPFLNDPSGEFALASPWVGVALFAPLPLCGGLLLGMLTPMLDRRTSADAERSVHVSWLIGLAVAVILAIMSIGSLMDSGARMPRALWDLYRVLDVPAPQALEINGLIGFVLMLGYVGGLIGLFFAGGQARAGRISVLTLLLFAAGFFNQQGVFSSMMDSLLIAALAAAVVKAAGAIGLLFLLHTFPDGRFAWRWSCHLVGGSTIGALIWFTLPVFRLDPSLWIAESLRLLVVAIILGSGGVVLGMRLCGADSERRRQIAGPSVGLAAALLWVLALWTAVLLNPNLGFSGTAAPFAPLGVALYLLPWLLPPLLLLHAVLRRGLWKVVQWDNHQHCAVKNGMDETPNEQALAHTPALEKAH